MKKRCLIISSIISAIFLILGYAGIKAITAKDNAHLEISSLEQLRALPYLAYSEEKADISKVGVVRYEPDLVFDGYNFYSGTLMDLKGELIYEIPARLTLITDDGYIFAFIKGLDLSKYDWDKNLIWKKDIKLHHEITLTHDNTILALTQEVHRYNGRDVEFGVILELSRDGEELSRWSTWDNFNYLKQFHKPNCLDKPEPPMDTKHTSSKSPFGGDYDYYHLNSIQVLLENPFGKKDKRFQKGNWLISLREENLVAILDKDTKKIVWSFGPGKIQRQHMPRMLDNGNIIIYDNGFDDRGHTRIIEINPVNKIIAWEYKADPPESFFSWGEGSAQRLPNGNTLIADSENGRAFEITKTGKIIWEWYNPKTDAEGRRQSIYRIIRYPKDKIDRFLNRN